MCPYPLVSASCKKGSAVWFNVSGSGIIGPRPAEVPAQTNIFPFEDIHAPRRIK